MVANIRIVFFRELFLLIYFITLIVADYIIFQHINRVSRIVHGIGHYSTFSIVLM